MIPPKYWSPTKKLMVLGAMAGGKTVEATALGNPLTFLTDLAKPLKSLLIPFTPQQEGIGDPSPQNVRPIVPWNGLKVWKSGSKNLFNAEIEQGELGYSTGAKTDSQTRIRSDYFFLHEGTYTVSSVGMNNVVVYVFDKEMHFISSESMRIWKNIPYTFNVSGERYIGFVWRKSGDPQVTPSDISDVMLNIGSNDQPYEPYKPITETDISFPSPVYGGEHEAVSGKLINGYGSYTFTGAEEDGLQFVYTREIGGISRHYFNATAIDRIAKRDCTGECYSNIALSSLTQNSAPCRFYVGTPTRQVILQIDESLCDPTVESFSAWLHDNNWQLVYPLAEPQEQTLTGQQITALVGDNTIWSDADGNMTAVYLKKG